MFLILVRHHEKIGEVKQNKGSILKASVDYTKMLKQDNELLHQKLVKAEDERKQLLLRLQVLFCSVNFIQQFIPSFIHPIFLLSRANFLLLNSVWNNSASRVVFKSLKIS